MTEAEQRLEVRLDEFLAELTAAAYGVALRHAGKSAFIDLELGLWRELETVVRNGRQATELTGFPASWPGARRAAVLPAVVTEPQPAEAVA